MWLLFHRLLQHSVRVSQYQAAIWKKIEQWKKKLLSNENQHSHGHFICPGLLVHVSGVLSAPLYNLNLPLVSSCLLLHHTHKTHHLFTSLVNITVECENLMVLLVTKSTFYTINQTCKCLLIMSILIIPDVFTVTNNWCRDIHCFGKGPTHLLAVLVRWTVAE